MKYTILITVRLDALSEKKLSRLTNVMRRDKSDAIRTLIQDADIAAYKRYQKPSVKPDCDAKA